VFFNLTGASPASPLVGVSFAGLGFRDQRPAMLEPWLVPSGGDWALRRAGALHLESTVGVSITNCAFIRTDANAVMVSGYNRNATIEGSVFRWLGMSAVALMGDCAQDDCTGGEQPWGIVLSRNVFAELGIIEKQSSALFLGKAALTRFEGSLAFNGPRAMINFNDAMGGGHNVSHSAIWNTCRESGDHGPRALRSVFCPPSPLHLFYPFPAHSTPPPHPCAVNSWNRIPYASRIATEGGEVSYAAALSEVHHTFINAGYGGSQAFDSALHCALCLALPLALPPPVPHKSPTPSLLLLDDDGSAYYNARTPSLFLLPPQNFIPIIL
jgi:hypothetical protein